MILTGGKIWFTAQEIADLALPGLPKAKRKVNERAEAELWAMKVDAAGLPLARPRQGRGGGLEYHHSILPAAARAELVKRGVVLDASDPSPAGRSVLWSWFDGQSDDVKDVARGRLKAIVAFDLFRQAGMSTTAAVAATADDQDVSVATVNNWRKLVEGVRVEDRLPHLAPRRQGGGAKADIDEMAWQLFLADYLRPEGPPTLASCYRRLVTRYAEPQGISLPHWRTFERKIARDVDPRLVIYKRKGADALRGTLPPQRRTVAGLHAMELVNIDGHKFDVFVRFPDGTIQRPIMVAIQDVYSRKVLARRVGMSESAVQTRLCFADLFRDFGIPKGCVLDNGRAFASKWITGGARSRFRFKIREDEPTGLLTGLGIEIHWALPFRGQSKPIERAFGDMCKNIATDPEFAGAYTGNRPDAKPENYGSRAVPLADFMRVLDLGLAEHNARIGRDTEIAHGRSFDAAFEESYASAPIGKATAEELRQALLTGEQLRPDRKSGHITIAGNRYWTPELSQLAGQLLTVRFDPDDLTLPIHIYDRGGEYICSAPIWEDTGFLDIASAKARAKLEGDLRKAVREVERRTNLLTAAEVADAYRTDRAPAEPVAVEPSVIRPVRHRGNTAVALKAVSEPSQKTQRDEFQAAMSKGIAALRLVGD